MQRRLVLLGFVIAFLVAPGAATAAPGVGDDYDCSETTEIPVVMSGDEVIRTENVSTPWYEHNEYVNQRQEKFIETYPLGEYEWLYSVGITATDEPICDSNQMAITVGVTDAERAREEFGDSFGGVELSIDEGEREVAFGGSELGSGDAEGSGDNTRTGASDEETDDPDEIDNEGDPLPGFGVLPVPIGLGTSLILLRDVRR